MREEWLAGGEPDILTPALRQQPGTLTPALSQGEREPGSRDETVEPSGTVEPIAPLPLGEGKGVRAPGEGQGVRGKTRTLTNLYNKRPDWLDLAHKWLDAAVFDAYTWPHDLSDDEILERLLVLNLQRAAAQGAVAAPVEVDAEGEPASE